MPKAKKLPSKHSSNITKIYALADRRNLRRAELTARSDNAEILRMHHWLRNQEIDTPLQKHSRGDGERKISMRWSSAAASTPASKARSATSPDFEIVHRYVYVLIPLEGDSNSDFPARSPLDRRQEANLGFASISGPTFPANGFANTRNRKIGSASASMAWTRSWPSAITAS